MKYFVPQLKAAEDLSSQTSVKEKLGGLPFGLPIEMYPFCRSCGNPMSLLAQFIHNDDRLNLGKEGRNLFIFQCNNVDSDFSICPTWEADSGANACFVIESAILSRRGKISAVENVIAEKETLILDWRESNEGITEDESRYFFDTAKYDKLAFTQFIELLDKTSDVTKLGGVPYWIQYPEIPEGSWKFVGQLDSNNGFEFGDSGIGYIFIEESDNSLQVPQGKFLWQCG